MDLDPDKVVNTAEEAAIQAELLKAFQATQPQPEQPVAGADAADPTGAGGGTIGIGMAPGPQEQGFTGNEQRPAEAGGPTEGAGGEQPVA